MTRTATPVPDIPPAPEGQQVPPVDFGDGLTAEQKRHTQA